MSQPGAVPVTGPQLDNRRILAAVIDLGLMAPVAVVLVLVFGGFEPSVAVLVGSWALYYFFAFESGDGQTLGKRVMKLRVARADGGSLDAGRVAVRTLLRPVDLLAGLVAMAVTGDRRQRVGDLAAGTVVTEASAPVLPGPAVESFFEVVAAREPVAAPEPVADTLLPPLPSQLLHEPPAVPAEVEPELDLPEPEAEVEPGDFEPIADPAPEAEVEPEPVELEPEPAEVEPAAEAEAVADEPPAPAPAGSPKLEIISSAIDAVMADEDEPDSPADEQDQA